MMVFLPYLSSGTTNGNNLWYRYAWLDASLALRNMFTHPGCIAS
jgi:hypothetical protein